MIEWSAEPYTSHTSLVQADLYWGKTHYRLTKMVDHRMLFRGRPTIQWIPGMFPVERVSPEDEREANRFLFWLIRDMRAELFAELW
jgi:hypothetical protein